MKSLSRNVGFTTSVPIEVLYAAGRIPVDLNNVFISSPKASALIEDAERQGFPRTCCAWVKGIYGVAKILELEEVIAVVRGDCSNSQALMEMLQMDGVRVYPFSYPYDRSCSAMEEELRKLREHYRVEQGVVEQIKNRVDGVRKKLILLDSMTWKEDLVWGGENHAFLVASSDMKGDLGGFDAELDRFLSEAARREPIPTRIRLGYIGVPPIFSDLYSYVEREGVRVVFNEIPRQFSMPYLCSDLSEQYVRYTYPYDIFFRINDISTELRKRRIQGVIHYVQAFCFRQIEDRIVRTLLDAPVLTLEGDVPGPLDERTRLRIEAFLEMLEKRETVEIAV